MTMTLKLVQRRGEDGIIGCALESRAGSGQSPNAQSSVNTSCTQSREQAT
jgi:hypothetical protein